MAAAQEVVEDQAFVTLATNDTYALGALVLSHSLHRVGTTRKLAVLVTPGISPAMREKLSASYDDVIEVNVLDSRDTANLALLTRPDLGVTFTKLHCWRLTQYKKCVFMDADTLVMQNIDDLFLRDEISAAPDVGWPDCFNSGVFVFVPSEQTYQSLITFALTQGSFDGGDQGLLNLYFSEWATKDIKYHLPFVYNVVSQTFYSYMPAYKQYGKNVKVAHFIGALKPWHHVFNTATGQVEPQADAGHNIEFLQLWWSIFMEHIQPMLEPGLGGIVGELASLKLGDLQYTKEQLEDRQRQYAWERGQIDYKGIDAFQHIQQKLEDTLKIAKEKEKHEAEKSEKSESTLKTKGP
jgi:glycogenin glucosyltransferase